MKKPPKHAGDENQGLTKAADILPAIMQPLTPIEKRQPLSEEEGKSILFQHTVMCQAYIPYRDPGDDVRIWKRRNGLVKLELQAGRLLDPRTDEFVDVGLPFGPKARLVLYHLNAEAKRHRSPIINMGDSLTSFVKRVLKLDPKGRNIRIVRDQLNRLAGAEFRLGLTYDGRARTAHRRVIDDIELWTAKSENQQCLWPSTVQFSDIYFQSLMVHAVPLNERAVAKLSHTAMGLDVYTWLAQRLHRVPSRKPAIIPWAALHEQFGGGYDRVDDFRRKFKQILAQVVKDKDVYPEAKIEVDEKGLRLHYSRPPVPHRDHDRDLI